MSSLKFSAKDIEYATDKWLERREKRINDRIEEKINDLMQCRRYYFFGSRLTREEATAIVYGEDVKKTWVTTSDGVFNSYVQLLHFRGGMWADKVHALNVASKKRGIIEIQLSLEDFNCISEWLDNIERNEDDKDSNQAPGEEAKDGYYCL